MPTLYQQGTQRIEIIVRKDTTGGEIGAKETETDQVSSENAQNDENQSQSRISSKTQRMILTNATHAAAVAKQAFNLTVDDYISRLGYQNGDSAYQQQVQRSFEVVKDTSNIASATIMGALYGSHGGFIGTVLGGVLGFATSGISTFFKYRGREEEFNYKTFKENNAIAYQRARAGINLTTGRLR